MDSDLFIRGMLIGMKEMGATFVKASNTHLYFDIKKGSDIDDYDKLNRVRYLVNYELGLGLKIKRIN